MTATMNRDNATKMAPFWKAYWAAKNANNTAVKNAFDRMVNAAAKRRQPDDADWQVVKRAAGEAK